MSVGKSSPVDLWLRVLAVGLSMWLGAGCSTAKSLARVRAGDVHEGLTLVVHGELSSFARDVPPMLRELGYQDITLEPAARGALQVIAAKPARWEGMGLGVRIIGEAAARGTLTLRLSFARRFAPEGSENVPAARDSLVKRLRAHFGVVS